MPYYKSIPAKHLMSFSQLNRIEGLTEKFLYFNDDILLTSPTSPDDFCFGWNGQKIRKDGPVSKCARGCNWSKMGDGICQVLFRTKYFQIAIIIDRYLEN